MITLYLDMDGVIADFDKAYRAFDPDKSDRKKFRSSVMDGKIFETLELMPNGRAVLDFVQSFFVEEHKIRVEMLTSMGTFDKEQGAEAKRQKLVWLEKHGITYPANFSRSKEEKALYAHQFAILLDDSIGCIEPFNQKGGHGILHDDSDHKLSLFNLHRKVFELNQIGATAL